MRKGVLLGLLAVLIAAVLLFPEARERWRRMGLWGDYSGYNFLLITLDTTRADFLSCYNRGLEPMPGIERASGGGVLFRAATAPTTTTVPSHASILTGLYPSEHGILHNIQPLDTAWVSMAEMFGDAGYRTAAFLSAEGILSRNLGQGFETIDDTVPPGELLGWQRSAASTNRRAFEWLAANVAEPFFLWVHYYDPHTPMVATLETKRRVPGYDGPFCWGLRVEDVPGHLRGDTLSAEDRAFLRALYEEEVRVMDEGIRDLLLEIEELGLGNRTVVLFAGDHGQSLGEKNYIGHDGDLLHEPLLHVPLLLCLPPAPRGVPGETAGLPYLREQVSDPVGLCDVLPTVLALFPALAPPPYPISGRSLLPLCERIGGRRALRAVFSEAPADLEEGVILPRRIFAATDGRWKIVIGPYGTAFYDLLRDPDEERPADAGARRAREMEEELREWVASLEVRGPRRAPPVAEETMEALQALGYLPVP
ncbi:MAG: sulfatase-like hydrolase/transferase [Candidatus Eisenbacteria bacterium]